MNYFECLAALEMTYIFPDFSETTYTFMNEYSDVAGIDVSSIDTNDVRVTGPGGRLTVTVADVDIGIDSLSGPSTRRFVRSRRVH